MHVEAHAYYYLILRRRANKMYTVICVIWIYVKQPYRLMLFITQILHIYPTRELAQNDPDS